MHGEPIISPASIGTVGASTAALGKLVARLSGDEVELRICYEAGPCGYGVYRHVMSLGVDCMVVAPSLIPRKPGDRVKTNRRDAEMLAVAHRAGTLTAVWAEHVAHQEVAAAELALILIDNLAYVQALLH